MSYIVLTPQGAGGPQGEGGGSGGCSGGTASARQAAIAARGTASRGQWGVHRAVRGCSLCVGFTAYVWLVYANNMCAPLPAYVWWVYADNMCAHSRPMYCCGV